MKAFLRMVVRFWSIPGTNKIRVAWLVFFPSHFLFFPSPGGIF